MTRTADEPVQCSAKGCREPAQHVLVWNNPKVHTPDREKTWAACDRHRGSLGEHLDVRGFLRRVDPLPPSEAGQHLDAARATCPTCAASFPVEQSSCPVCAGVRTGSCGSPDEA